MSIRVDYLRHFGFQVISLPKYSTHQFLWFFYTGLCIVLVACSWRPLGLYHYEVRFQLPVKCNRSTLRINHMHDK
jgi:hypothetical protein